MEEHEKQFWKEKFGQAIRNEDSLKRTYEIFDKKIN